MRGFLGKSLHQVGGQPVVRDMKIRTRRIETDRIHIRNHRFLEHEPGNGRSFSICRCHVVEQWRHQIDHPAVNFNPAVEVVGVGDNGIVLRFSKNQREVGRRAQVVPRHAGNRARRTQLVVPLEHVSPGHREEQAGLGRIAWLIRHDGMNCPKQSLVFGKGNRGCGTSWHVNLFACCFARHYPASGEQRPPLAVNSPSSSRRLERLRKMIPSTRFTPSAFTPTDEQREIQTAGARVILVEANAGAAKTTTLALRIGESLARGVPAAGMLALVFTEEAREVMRRRLVEVGIAPALAAAVRVETFDSLAQAVLQEYEGFAVPSATAPQLREQVLAALDHVSAKYQYRYSGLEIATHNLAVSQFLDLQMAVKARLSYPEDANLLGHQETAEVMGLSLTHLLTFLEYEEVRLGVFGEAKFRGPFDDTYDLARNLGERPEIADFLPTCQLVVCDELHDMNEAAFRILLALLDKGNMRGKAWFVGAGDKDQVIHAHARAPMPNTCANASTTLSPPCAACRCQSLTAMAPTWHCPWVNSRTSPRSRGSPP